MLVLCGLCSDVQYGAGLRVRGNEWGLVGMQEVQQDQERKIEIGNREEQEGSLNSKR